MENQFFKKAKPIYLKDKQNELNSFAAFRAEINRSKHPILYVTAATFYRLTVNGKFAAFGPARTAKNYARVDKIELSEYLSEGKNEIIIEVAGYYCSSLSTIKQTSFLWAEIRSGNEVLAATGEDFQGFCPSYKLRKVKRYSFQRHFGEVWDLRNDAWKLRDEDRAPVEILDLPITLLDRVAPYPCYEDSYCKNIATSGTLTYDETLPYRDAAYSVNPMPDGWGYFDDAEISTFPFVWVQRHRQNIVTQNVELPAVIRENEYAILDFKRIECGFMLFSATAMEESDVIISFSEDCSAEKFNFTDMNAQTVWEIMLSENQKTNMMTFEPYTFRYAMVSVRKGAVSLEKLGVKTFQHDIRHVTIPQYENPALTSVYRGAVRTFAHNAVDLYMDCPSRERAGWLCDTYFTSQSEFALFNETAVEDAFLENYRLYQNEGEFPDGVLPMCYPSDPQPVGDINKFIPQWDMWYIIEVADYLTERNPKMDRELFRASIEKLLDFFKRYENEDGLLERLPSWNFVEWSDANKWTWDVNYPTNFLYAKVFESYYRIYGDEKALQKCREIQKKTIEQSFNGRYFLDHAIRNEDGKLELQKESSEAGQYYAILFGGFDIHDETYRELYRLVTEVFAAERKSPVPEIMEINAFIGAYLRLEALLKMGEYPLVLRDIDEFFGKMEEETGTLWEYRQHHGSRDHGFASFALVAMQKATEALKNNQKS